MSDGWTYEEAARLGEEMSDEACAEIRELEEENAKLKLRIHAANTLLFNSECWLTELDRTGIERREPGWRPFMQAYTRYRVEMVQNHDWWQWDELEQALTRKREEERP